MQSLDFETKTINTLSILFIETQDKTNLNDSFSRRKQMKKKNLRENHKNTYSHFLDQSRDIKYDDAIEIKLGQLFLKSFSNLVCLKSFSPYQHI